MEKINNLFKNNIFKFILVCLVFYYLDFDSKTEQIII